MLAGVSAALLLVCSLLVYNLTGDPMAMSLTDAEQVLGVDLGTAQAAYPSVKRKPSVARRSPAMITPSRYLNERTVVPCGTPERSGDPPRSVKSTRRWA